MSVAVKEARKTLGEDPTRASRSVAVEASDRQVQAHVLIARPQVGRPSMIATMRRPTDGTTTWATGVIALRLSGNAWGSAILAPDVKKATTGDVTEKGHALI